jgi:glycosyltransferase involved in cell wall biosynthesis
LSSYNIHFMSESKPLRITFFTHYTELYGANLSMLALIDGLGRYGIRAHVICPDQGDLLPALSQRNIPFAQFPFEWWVSTQRTLWGAAKRFYRNCQLLHAINTQIVRWQTDLVYSNSSVFAIGAMASSSLHLPHIWHLREFGNRDYNLWPDLGAWLSRRIFRTAAARVFVSKALKQAFLGNTTPKNTYVIYNGVASVAVFEERRRSAEQLRGRRQPFTFVLVGRFRNSKGQAVAIDAFSIVARRFPEVRLILVGDAGNTGEQGYYDRCRTRVGELALGDRVEFWGYIPDPERAFLAADAALMCSQNEAMGRVTVEAMSACRPVIGNDSGGTSELIDHGRTGLLYRGTAVDLAECMTRYIQSPELARQHGEAGWQVASIRNSTETYSAHVYDVIAGICRKRHTSDV